MQLLHPILNVLFPSTCAVCGNPLTNENQLCLSCLNQMEFTHFSQQPNNPTEQLLAGRTHFQHATSILHFQQGNVTQSIIHAIKFHANSELSLLMGRQMGLQLIRSSMFDDIDILVPVPLHFIRKIQRGYNQSQLLCQGIAEVLPRPINSHSLIRHRYTHKQSLQRTSSRYANVSDAFRIRNADSLQGKHILLVDDVLTTGATIISCCNTLSQIPNIRISIATLSIAGT